MAQHKHAIDSTVNVIIMDSMTAQPATVLEHVPSVAGERYIVRLHLNGDRVAVRRDPLTQQLKEV